jgi:hypothetical protein
MLTYSQKYYRKNREHRKAMSQKYRKDHPNYKEYRRQYYKNHPFTLKDRYNRLCLALRAERVKKSDLIWNFDFYVKLVKGNKCHYCEGPLTPTGHNLDRKDNSKKHTAKNLVPCCRVCNYTKNKHFSYEEMLLLAPILRKIRRLRNR